MKFKLDENFESYGIVVIRVPRNPSLALLEQLVAQFLRAVAQISIAKELWIVEINRIRIHQFESEKGG